MSAQAKAERSYMGPAFKDAKVYDAMNVGVVTCRPETTLADVARMMVGYGMHSVVVSDLERQERAWGIVTSLDIAHAGEDIDSLNAADVAATDLVTVESNQPLKAAARLMADHRLNHLIAVEPDSGRPVGVISASAIAAALVYGGY